MFEDLVQRRQALDVLMSYNPFWLHNAVEVVTQKAFKPDSEQLIGELQQQQQLWQALAATIATREVRRVHENMTTA
jgi:hypothetical protein